MRATVIPLLLGACGVRGFSTAVMRTSVASYTGGSHWYCHRDSVAKPCHRLGAAACSGKWAGSGWLRKFSSDPMSSGLMKKENRVGAVFGLLVLFNFAAAIFIYFAAKAGIIVLPPVNVFTEISNAAMESRITDGTVSPAFATFWANRYFFSLLSEFYASGAPSDFVPTWCEAHRAICDVAQTSYANRVY